MYFKENIKFLRELLQMSQKAFDKLIFPFYAEDTFVTYKLENGKYRNPLPFLITIANHFHISLDKLIFTLITEDDIDKIFPMRKLDYFYLNFNRLKKYKNLTFNDIAQQTGLSIYTIINYSRSYKYYFIKLDNLYSISRFFGSSLDDLLCRDTTSN